MSFGEERGGRRRLGKTSIRKEERTNLRKEAEWTLSVLH